MEFHINWNIPKNEVKSLGSNEYIYGKTPADKMADEATIVMPGYSIGSFYGYIWEGISEDGKNVYADLNEMEVSMPETVL